jgi:hypothetical protein
MTGPPALRSGFHAAPPIKRAKPDWIPVRLSNGALVAHVIPELADRLIEAGEAESFRSGSRRYLRLRQGISIPRTEHGWDIIEFLRRWHGDKRLPSTSSTRIDNPNVCSIDRRICQRKD